MRARLKTLITVVAGALALVLALVVVRGLGIAGYEPVRSNNYLWGQFHAHSTLSDGLEPLETIAGHARAAAVDFVMLSEHGRPHREAAVLDETIDGVRFIGGSEVGVPDGHLIVSDVDALPDYNLPPFPPDAVADVREWGGMSVLTYPEDPTHRWRYWGQDFVPDGIEIINVTSYFRASSLWDKLAWAVFSVFNRHYYVSGFTSPAYALERWDELLTRGRVWGFYAANAHGGFPLTEETFVAFPSYETAFSFVGLGVDRRFASDPMRAIRDGRFFSVVRGAGEPNRFELVRENDGRLRVALDVDMAGTRVVLKRDGAVVAETGDSELVFETAAAGVYRVEVYLDDHPLLSPDVPWILSNPMFVDVEPGVAPVAALECEEVEVIDASSWHVEKDDASTAALTLDAGELTLGYELSESTAEQVDRWVALALRQPMDLAGFRGVYVSGRAPRPMRYWIELRSGDAGYYATFKVDAAGRASAIPWSRFYPTVGGDEGIPLAAIDAVFIAVNTMSSRTGFSSELTLTEVGWCQ